MKVCKLVLKSSLIVLILSFFALTSAAQNKKKAPLQEVTFIVNLHCENCVRKVQENIPFEKGVKDLKVSLERKTVWVRYSPDKTTKEKLAAAIEKLGYEVMGEETSEKK